MFSAVGGQTVVQERKMGRMLEKIKNF